jgi:hypothetical protein
LSPPSQARNHSDKRLGGPGCPGYRSWNILSLWGEPLKFLAGYHWGSLSCPVHLTWYSSFPLWIREVRNSSTSHSCLLLISIGSARSSS